MRFKLKKHELGDTRVKTAFLLLPKKIDNEWRWLEWVKWEQKCVARQIPAISYIYTSNMVNGNIIDPDDGINTVLTKRKPTWKRPKRIRYMCWMNNKWL